MYTHKSPKEVNCTSIKIITNKIKSPALTQSGDSVYWELGNAAMSKYLDFYYNS